MVVYGTNAVREALRGPRRVVRIWATAEARRRLSAIGAAVVARGDPPTAVLEREELDRLCGSTDHQGIACETEPYRYADAGGLLRSERALVIALDQVQDPQNLGAICRSAECAGVAGVVLPERRSAQVTPAVCRASAGAVEHLAVARVRNLADFLERAKEAGAWVYGTEAGAATPYTEADYGGRTVLVFGGEGAGIRPRVKAVCDQLVSIPLGGKIGSLNVSAAAAVLAYEALRQRDGIT